jgi:hypothetical protein
MVLQLCELPPNFKNRIFLHCQTSDGRWYGAAFLRVNFLAKLTFQVCMLDFYNPSFLLLFWCFCNIFDIRRPIDCKSI